MAPEPTPNGGSVFAVVCNLPPGYHQYKFIVDGEWRHDENQAFIQDPLGNVNNWCERRVNLKPNLPRAPHAPARARGGLSGGAFLVSLPASWRVSVFISLRPCLPPSFLLACVLGVLACLFLMALLTVCVPGVYPVARDSERQ